ncbi:hypothetical protein QTP70_013530 [Hemibagrus guttatus]|uniref:ribonuclease H n=1 Tax=Hemibagrus guttatus TaxID=175788 RepID=A0AAE0UIG9_9TELE|nr:hypothetical protein QTP70_013530 [Hemibagrus guttatus]
MEKYRDGQRELHCVFVDLEKAYDRVPREELWYCMRKSGVAEKYVRVVQDMYERSRTVVRCAVGQTEEFNVEVGLHQVSALSPFLFAIVMDQLSEEVRQESPWTMMFADDIVICSESREQVEENLERWRFALERRGMKVSRSKTEYMCVNEREGSGTVRLQDEEVKKVQEFKYLGSTVQSNGECGKEVKKRVQAGWNGWRKVSGVLCDQKISAGIKGKVYRTVVRPAMLYGLETVSLRKRQESELEVAELKMLRGGNQRTWKKPHGWKQGRDVNRTPNSRDSGQVRHPLGQSLLDHGLPDRQFVRLGTHVSDLQHISTGSPQGCVLFPLLFSLYTNGCTSGHQSVKLLKFADDTTLISLISDGDESAYRGEIDRLVSWCSTNNLELNSLKTVEMKVDFRKNPSPRPPVILCDSPVSSAESFCFLGTTITKELKWEQNIRSLTKKAQQRMYFLRQLKKFLLPVKMLVNFYTAIESVLTSSITVWFAAATAREKAKLQRVIHSAEKVIGCSLPSLQELYVSRSRRRAAKIAADPSHPGKGRELADMMERRKVDILCVQETKWKGSKARSIGAGFKLFYYGVDSKTNGVGVVLKEEFVRNVLEVKRVSDRVMSLKLEIEGVMLNVVSGYAPQVGCELEEKERFWSELDEVMESIPTGERVVIGADFNGHVGEGNTGDEEVMGKFGVKERNLEGQMVVDFAKRMDMAVVNTYFQKREEHRVTYKSGGRRTQMKRSKIEIEKKTKWWKLKKEECCEEFRQKLRQALGGQVVLPDDWETTAEVIRETGRKVLGVSSGRRKEDKETWWWNEEVQDSVQRKRLAKKKWDMDRTEENRQEYKELQRRVKREVSKAKQKAYDELYTRLDTSEGEKDLYRLARQRDRDGKDVQQVRVIKDRDGRVLTSEESVQRR